MPFPIPENEIAKIEAILGCRLPISYRDSMKSENGGDIFVQDENWILHPIRNEESRKHITRTTNDVLTETTSAREWAGFSADYLVIASNGVGDHLVFQLEEGEISATVYAWYHETKEQKVVADDFRLITRV